MSANQKTTAHRCMCRDCGPCGCGKGADGHCATCADHPQTTRPIDISEGIQEYGRTIRGENKTTIHADPEDEFYGGLYWVKGNDEFGLGPGLRTATPGECASEIRRLRKIEVAARCIRHWHDHVFSDGSEGMVVSASHVRALWEALGETNNGH